MPKNWNPHYIKHVLEPHFVQAEQHFLQPLLEISQAHAVMLFRCGLLEKGFAQRILEALRAIQDESFTYSTAFEDLFFTIEARVMAAAGAEAAGNLQIARSRNDVDAALIRMVLRDQVLGLLGSLEETCAVLLARGFDGLTWLMPGYTHHQPAQPTTLGHYLSGILNVLERDTGRIKAAYSSINYSPLGAVAMTGTAFAINRDWMQRWLGFDAILENGIDAVSAVDHSLELLNAIRILCTNLSRLTHDLIFWASQEIGFFRVADEFVQISSIMPQKRNPVVLEHIRAKLARASGHCNTAFTMTNNIPFGDVNDIAEPLLPISLAALSDVQAALALLTAVLQTSSFNIKKMRVAAAAHFITATGLADALVGIGMTFKQAHQIVSRTVDYAVQNNLHSSEITAQIVQSVSETPLEITAELIKNALDPQVFVEKRTTLGGSAPNTVKTALEQSTYRFEQHKTWRLEQLEKQQIAKQKLEIEITTVFSD